jgi:hypothetical protein
VKGKEVPEEKEKKKGKFGTLTRLISKKKEETHEKVRLHSHLNHSIHPFLLLHFSSHFRRIPLQWIKTDPLNSPNLVRETPIVLNVD